MRPSNHRAVLYSFGFFFLVLSCARGSRDFLYLILGLTYLALAFGPDWTEEEENSPQSSISRPVLLIFGFGFLTASVFAGPLAIYHLIAGMYYLFIAFGRDWPGTGGNDALDPALEKRRNRPASVTVIAGLMIVMGPLQELLLWMYVTSPMAKRILDLAAVLRPASLSMSFMDQMILSTVWPLVGLGCGLALLRGWAWARWLCVGCIAIRLVAEFVFFSHASGVISYLAWLIVAVMFLFDSDADEFFAVRNR